MRMYFVVLAVLLTSSCADVLEKNISGKVVVLVAPADSLVTDYRDQTFAWEELTGATSYRLVVVSPEFEKVERYLLDTVMAECHYRQILPEGDYEWKVQALNSAYRSADAFRSFSIRKTVGNH